MYKDKSHETQPTVFEDAIIAGVLLAKGHQVIPQINNNKRIKFQVSGDVNISIAEIYSNTTIGSLDVIKGIKATLGMIFNLKASSNKEKV
ncbi:MAG: hypothetical protein HQK91_07310 [Nitrospirae bacterium]|nr:hypothetical protein [Nitrospirota bacterium]